MLLLGLDFETQGLDPKVHSISEVGAQLYDTDYHRSVETMSYLVEVAPGAPFEQEAIDATGLTADILAKYGKNSLTTLKKLLNMYDDADYIVAHNGNACDRPFLRAWMTAHNLLDVFPEDKFWIDTLTDVEYPNKRWNKQLTCLAAYHGFLNPFPHEAIGDVMTMLKVLDHYPIDKVIAYAKTPWIGIRLAIPFEKNQWGKDNGYFWYKDKNNSNIKFWMKKIKEDKFEEENALVKAAGFLITRIDIPEGVY